MLPDKPIPGSAADWLRRARSDLTLANVSLPRDALYNELCFHAQQAAEKSIKAVLVHCGVEFPKVHDVGYLMTLLPAETAAPPNAEEIAELNIYAVILRYPGDYEDVTEEEHVAALQTAQSVYDWAARVIRESNPK